MRYPADNHCGFKHYIEPCECDLKEKQEEFKFYLKKERNDLKELVKLLFPLQNEYIDKQTGQIIKIDDISTYKISEFVKRTGTENALEAASDYIENFNEYRKKGLGLLFSGTYGNGKTHLSKCILNYLRHENIVIFIEFGTLFDKIQSTYSKDLKYNTEEYYKCLENCDLLVIDEIGVGEWKADREKILLRVINKRKELKKPIVFTMNPEGEKQLAERVKDRIKEICYPVINEGTSMRSEILQLKLQAASN